MDIKGMVTELDKGELEYIDGDIYQTLRDNYFECDSENAYEGLDENGGLGYPLLAMYSGNETWQLFRPGNEQIEADFLLEFAKSSYIAEQRPSAISYFTLRCLPEEFARNLYTEDRYIYLGAVLLCFNISKMGSYLNIFSPVLDQGNQMLQIDGQGILINDRIVDSFFGAKSAHFKQLISKVDSGFSRFTQFEKRTTFDSDSDEIPDNLIDMRSIRTVSCNYSGQGRATTDNLEGEEVPS